MSRLLTPLSTLFHRLFSAGSTGPQPDVPLDEAAWLATWPRHDLPAAALSFASPPHMVLQDASDTALSFHGVGLFGALLIVMAQTPEPGVDWSNPDAAISKILEFVDDERDSGYRFLESGVVDAPAGGTWLAGSYGAGTERLALGFVHALIPTPPVAVLIHFVDMGILDAREEGVPLIEAVARSISPVPPGG